MESALFYTSNQTWKEFDGISKAPGKGVHAEIALYNGAMKKNVCTTSNVWRFVQEGAPCETCHSFFRTASENGRSFIFCISGAGYAIPYQPQKGDQIPAQFTAFVNQGGWLNIDPSQFPAVLYYHGGTVFMNARQIGFPECPVF